MPDEMALPSQRLHRTLPRSKKVKQFINSRPPESLLDFMGLAENVRRQEILDWLDQYQQARFAAEPVYGPTGKGFLVSQGVDGLVAEQNLANALAPTNSEPAPALILDKFCNQLAIRVMRRLQSPVITESLGLNL